ncbi:MAG: hypothetical protein AAGH79_14790 [Bacteroidota bacterium]
MKTPYYLLLSMAFVFFFGSSLIAKNANSLFDLLSKQEVLELKIVTSLDRLTDNDLNRKYQPAKALFEIGNKSFEMDLKVKSRGRFRRRICDFPPLKLNFDKDELEELGLLKFDKLKLVTHCMDEKFISKENVIREFLAYQLYQDISAYSLRVQLVEVTYVDELKPSNKVKRWGFLIEDIDELAARVGAVELDTFGLGQAQMDGLAWEKMTVFQYMIGNTDWDIRMARNVKILQIKKSGALIPVPYDFDFAGLVNAPYAVPNPDFQIASVKDRVYQGEDQNNAHLGQTLFFFKQHREKLLQRVEDLPELSRDTRYEVSTFLNSFFDQDINRVNELSARENKVMRVPASEVLQTRGN